MNDEQRAPLTLTVFVALLSLALTAWGQTVLWVQRPTYSGLFLSHYTHLSWTQMFWAGGPSLVFLALCEQRAQRLALLYFLGCASFVVCFSVALFDGQLVSYQGLSGLGHSLAGLWLLAYAPRTWLWPGLLTLSLKLGYELQSGSVALEMGLGQARAVPVAHVAGCVFGLVIGLGLRRYQGCGEQPQALKHEGSAEFKAAAWSPPAWSERPRSRVAFQTRR